MYILDHGCEDIGNHNDQSQNCYQQNHECGETLLNILEQENSLDIQIQIFITSILPSIQCSVYSHKTPLRNLQSQFASLSKVQCFFHGRLYANVLINTFFVLVLVLVSHATLLPDAAPDRQLILPQCGNWSCQRTSVKFHNDLRRLSTKRGLKQGTVKLREGSLRVPVVTGATFIPWHYITNSAWN